MKKIILAIFVMALMVSCKQEKVDYTVISGKIANAKNEVILYKGVDYRDMVKAIPIAKDGSFRDTIFNAEGFYTLGYSDKTTTMYLENGFDLTINVDAKQFMKTIVYEGKGEKPNNYLAKKSLKQEEIFINRKALFGLEEELFLEKLNTIKNELEADLKSIDGEFVKKEQKALDYNYILDLKNYQQFHGFFTKNMNFKVSDKFPNLLKDMDFTNEKDFDEYGAYRQLVSEDFFNKVRVKAIETKGDFFDISIEEIKKMKEGSIKKALVGDLGRSVIGVDEQSQKLYNAFMELSTDEKAKKRLKKVMDNYKKLKKGNPSPTFENYENYQGGKTSLKDFKGKYVYIDVWATWCGPCQFEIPFMKKLEKKYHKNKKIVFVSISIDDVKQKGVWESEIKKKQMTGIQLFADKSSNSDFIQNYGINSIPRFILIDPKGNIVSSDAPMPSDPKLIQLFKEQGIR